MKLWNTDRREQYSTSKWHGIRSVASKLTFQTSFQVSVSSEVQMKLRNKIYLFYTNGITRTHFFRTPKGTENISTQILWNNSLSIFVPFFNLPQFNESPKEKSFCQLLQRFICRSIFQASNSFRLQFWFFESSQCLCSPFSCSHSRIRK